MQLIIATVYVLYSCMFCRDPGYQRHLPLRVESPESTAMLTAPNPLYPENLHVKFQLLVLVIVPIPVTKLPICTCR